MATTLLTNPLCNMLIVTSSSTITSSQLIDIRVSSIAQSIVRDYSRQAFAIIPASLGGSLSGCAIGVVGHFLAPSPAYQDRVRLGAYHSFRRVGTGRLSYLDSCQYHTTS